MFNTLLTRLGISQQEKDQLGSTVSSIKDVSEYLSDVAEIAKDSDYLKAISAAAPWAGVVVDALGEAIPPVKFAAKLFEGLTKEHDPEALGHLACTLAYQSAIEQTVKAMEVPIVSQREVKDLRKHLAELEPSAAIDFGIFSFEDALSHDFITKADGVLQVYAKSVGYNQEQTLRLLAGVHTRFVGEVKTFLSHGKLKDRFEPFTTLMGLGAAERQAYKALSEHAEYQRWLYEKAPVLKKEPYALTDIYVNTECGNLTWSEISKPLEKTDTPRANNYRNPFSEKWGGRSPMIETVMALIADASFKDAIVVQGAAGAGKSSFTLKLCSALLNEGLRPIRVRLRDLRLDLHVSESLPQAVRLGDDNYSPNDSSQSPPEDLFLGGSIFKEKVQFRGTTICPYILIMDGWDEISIAANDGFKVRIAKLLDEIRSEYLKDRKVPVRVILTGRPSTDVSESKFFRDKTRILTIRSLRPGDLENFIEALRKALESRPIPVSEAECWEIQDAAIFKPVLELYKQDFDVTISAENKNLGTKTWERFSPTGSGSMAVLGLPLLAHLAIRLISQWPGDRAELVSDPTTLYRSLVDLTSQQSGKAPDDLSGYEGQLRLAGSALRNLLWQTAAAMSILGEESIPYAELGLRLGLQGDSLYQATEQATNDNVLSSLMISFYFKGGQTQLGAEFLHKSFREYLFAEGVVQILKEYGDQQRQTLPERDAYWREFQEDDPRFSLTRRLSEQLAPQWLSPEVGTHIEQLIKWEIARSDQHESQTGLGTPTNPLDLEGWMRVRDGLADVWDWWCEGIHLRPQPVRDRSGVYNFGQPYVQELIETASPRDVQQKLKPQIPNRTVTLDAHLGDGLIRLCAFVHYLIAIKSGWLEDPNSSEKRTPAKLWEGVSPIAKGPRRCQSVVQQGNRSWVFFAPSGSDPRYFTNYIHRINGAGWRPGEHFPLGANLSGIDLRNTSISIAYPYSEAPPPSIWKHANLSGVLAPCSSFYKHDFREVLAEKADFSVAYFVGADFHLACLDEVMFSLSCCSFTHFDKASLKNAKLMRTDLENAIFKDADLRGADFSEARIFETTSFEGANIQDAKLNLPETGSFSETEAPHKDPEGAETKI